MVATFYCFSGVVLLSALYPSEKKINALYINICCNNRVTLFANFSYIRATIWCRRIVFSTLCRRILLSEIAQIASLFIHLGRVEKL